MVSFLTDVRVFLSFFTFYEMFLNVSIRVLVFSLFVVVLLSPSLGGAAFSPPLLEWCCFLPSCSLMLMVDMQSVGIVNCV